MDVQTPILSRSSETKHDMAQRFPLTEQELTMLRAFLREEGRVDRLEPLIDLCVKRTQRIIS